MKIIVDTAVYYERGKVINCDFKPGSVEGSIDPCQRGYTSAGDAFNFRHQ
jgi:hypothetical protein